jgi:hypothetical protein
MSAVSLLARGHSQCNSAVGTVARRGCLRQLAGDQRASRSLSALFSLAEVVARLPHRYSTGRLGVWVWVGARPGSPSPIPHRAVSSTVPFMACTRAAAFSSASCSSSIDQWSSVRGWPPVLLAWRIRSSACAWPPLARRVWSGQSTRWATTQWRPPPRGLFSTERELPAVQRLDRERADLDHGELEALRRDVGPHLDVDVDLLAPVEDERPGA